MTQMLVFVILAIKIAIIILIALLFKILVMIKVFGWYKTKKLLKYHKYRIWMNFTPIELTNALEEIRKDAKRGVNYESDM